MEVEFDENKQKTNLAKHGVSFLEAARIFLDPCFLAAPDDRKDYGEERRIAVGEVQGRVYVVVYTLRDEVARIISARKANEREQKKYRARQA